MLSYQLNPKEYSLTNALLWGNFAGHRKLAREGALGNRRVHLLIAAIELLPIISQIASLMEWAIVKIAESMREASARNALRHRPIVRPVPEQEVKVRANRFPLDLVINLPNAPVQDPAKPLKQAGLSYRSRSPILQELIEAIEKQSLADVERVIKEHEQILREEINNNTDFSHFPALFVAAEKGNLEIVKRLVALGAKSRVMNPIQRMHDPINTQTAADAAAMSGQAEVLKYLIALGSDITLHLTTKGGMPHPRLPSIIQSGNLECVKVYVESIPDRREYFDHNHGHLESAFKSDNAEIFQYLLDQGCSGQKEFLEFWGKPISDQEILNYAFRQALKKELTHIPKHFVKTQLVNITSIIEELRKENDDQKLISHAEKIQDMAIAEVATEMLKDKKNGEPCAIFPNVIAELIGEYVHTEPPKANAVQQLSLSSDSQ